MSDKGASPGEFGWPWTFRWPAEGGAGPAISFAPERLWQPINPGWTFGNVIVNSTNSSAPEVEQAVTSRFSYGRQIGRMMDAVEALVKATPSIQSDPGVKDFVTLAGEVRDAKKAAESSRLDRLRAELDAVKKSDPAAWRRLVKP